MTGIGGGEGGGLGGPGRQSTRSGSTERGRLSRMGEDGT